MEEELAKTNRLVGLLGDSVTVRAGGTGGGRGVVLLLIFFQKMIISVITDRLGYTALFSRVLLV